MRQKVSKLTSKVVFCDPLNNAATGNVRSLAELAIQTISSEPSDHTIVAEGRHHVLHIPTQPNCWDCVFYVMKTIEMLIEEFLRGWISPTFVSVIQMPYSCGRVGTKGTRICTCDRWPHIVNFVSVVFSDDFVIELML